MDDNYEWKFDFEKSKSILIEKVLSDHNNKPYTWIDIRRTHSDYHVDWENEKIVFNSVSSIYKEDLSLITHELGHLMITRNEGIGQSSWGLGNPYQVFTGLSIDPSPTKNRGQLTTESKVWAWQYLIECMAGFREFGSPIPEHGEARYLADGLSASNNNESIETISIQATQKELDKILSKFPLWKEEIANRMKSIPGILKELKEIQLTSDDLEKGVNIKKFTCEELNEGIIQTIEINKFPKGWYEVIMKEVDSNENDEIINIETLCMTLDLKRAESFFNIAVNENNEVYDNDEDDNDDLDDNNGYQMKI